MFIFYAPETWNLWSVRIHTSTKEYMCSVTDDMNL